MVSEWPRLGIFLISVTLVLRFCRLYAALAIAQGTVWSFSPSRISSGPRSGFFVSTFDSVQGLRLALAIWARAIPDPAVQGRHSSSDRKHDGDDAEQHEPAAAPAGAAAAVATRVRTR